MFGEKIAFGLDFGSVAMRYRSYKHEQEAFKAVAKAVLGRDYAMVMGDAMDAYHEAVRRCKCKIKRENSGIFAANHVISSALRERGVHSWRKWLEEQQNPGYRAQPEVVKEPPKAGRTASGTSARVPGRKTILGMLEGNG